MPETEISRLMSILVVCGEAKKTAAAVKLEKNKNPCFSKSCRSNLPPPRKLPFIEIPGPPGGPTPPPISNGLSAKKNAQVLQTVPQKMGGPSGANPSDAPPKKWGDRLAAILQTVPPKNGGTV